MGREHGLRPNRSGQREHQRDQTSASPHT